MVANSKHEKLFILAKFPHPAFAQAKVSKFCNDPPFF